MSDFAHVIGKGWRRVQVDREYGALVFDPAVAVLADLARGHFHQLSCDDDFLAELQDRVLISAS